MGATDPKKRRGKTREERIAGALEVLGEFYSSGAVCVTGQNSDGVAFQEILLIGKSAAEAFGTVSVCVEEWDTLVPGDSGAADEEEDE
jgi:hypothetical protein